jgi:hypothetical protein
MELNGVKPGTHLVTMSGDIVELLEVAGNGITARVRYIQVLGGGGVNVNDEDSISIDDIATVDGDRFVGPPHTASTSA